MGQFTNILSGKLYISLQLVNKKAYREPIRNREFVYIDMNNKLIKLNSRGSGLTNTNL